MLALLDLLVVPSRCIDSRLQFANRDGTGRNEDDRGKSAPNGDIMMA